MKKLLSGAAGAILVAAIAAAAWYYFSFDQVALRAIERYGSEAIQGSVHAKGARISPDNGVGFVSGFAIDNPKGFSNSAAIAADSVKVELDPRSLAGNVLAIRILAMAAPRLSYETGAGGSNFDALLQGIQPAAGSPPSPPAGRKLTVGVLVISNASLSYRAADGQTVTIDHLPEIRLTNIGQSRGGVTPAELARAIAEAVIYQVRRALPASPAPGRQQGAAGN